MAIFHKVLASKSHPHSFSRTVFPEIQLFPGVYNVGYHFTAGYVTWLHSCYDTVYTEIYTQAFPDRNLDFLGLSVENLNFSTFSTGLSTMVFHRPVMGVYTTSVYIILFRQKMTNQIFLPFSVLTSPIFRRKNFGIDKFMGGLVFFTEGHQKNLNFFQIRD